LVAELHVAGSKNVGLFPEQEDNWDWLKKTLRGAKRQASVLNLFAYTGMASLVCAAEDALVCHVDSSKSTVNAAKNNQRLSGLEDKPIRYIVDDAAKFVEREIRRKNRYDGIILDPPPIGRSKAGSFRFEDHARKLLKQCKDLLNPVNLECPSFVLLNCYALNYTAQDAAKLLKTVFPAAHIQQGELELQESKREQILSCSVYARFVL
jgi:23S rRNA (cytosine1962-C5)-methyltransferase